MRIAELFVQLGFQVEGGEKLANVDRGLGKAQLSALGLLAAVGSLNAAFYLMMNRAVDTAVGLDMWRKSTGLNADELQRMQYGAAKANVTTGALAEALRNIQKVRSEIALGNVDASSPWFLLGIDPRQDPIKVLSQLQTAIAKMDPALARNLVGRMGFGDDILYLLQQKKTIGSLFVNDQDIERLTRLGGQWKAFLFNLQIVATKFAAVFAEGLQRVVGWLEKGTILMSKLVGWLNSGTTAANVMKTGLTGLVIVLGLVGIGLAVVTGLLAVLKGLIIAIQLIPVVQAATLLVGVLALMAGALVALILLIQDFWTQVDGGKSLFDWNKNLIISVRNVERLSSAIGWLVTKWKELGEIGKIEGFSTDIFGTPSFASSAVHRSIDNIHGPGGSRTVNNDIDIHVDGSRDPQTTGREVGRSVRREISDAMGTAPLPTR